MSKTSRLKVDLDDTGDLVEIIQILKDVSSNHFYNTAKRKQRFIEFAEAFIDFFRMVSLTNAHHKLVQSEIEKTAILLFTSEAGFMGELTARVIKAAALESERLKTNIFLVVGYKGVDKLKQFVPDAQIKLFRDIDEHGLYPMTLMIKEHIVQEVLADHFGRVVAIYPFAFSFQLIKPKTVKLLPSEELLTQQRELKETIEKVIVESNLNDVIGYLADIWLTCRIYEMMEDCVVAGFAAQAQQMEASLERLKKQKSGLMVSFRKAKRSDMDKSLKEVFTASVMTRR